MGTVQKIALAVVGVAFVTTLVLPTHNTVPVLGQLTKLSTGSLSVAEGTASGAIGG